MCEAIYELNLFHQITSNTSDLLTQVVFCKGVISGQPEADIFVARRIPAAQSACQSAEMGDGSSKAGHHYPG